MDKKIIQRFVENHYIKFRDQIIEKGEKECYYIAYFRPTLTSMEDLITLKQNQEFQDIGLDTENTYVEIANRWFNRFIALRYLEVNDLLPSGVRILSSRDDKFEPEILTKIDEVDLPGLDQDKVKDFQKKNDKNGLYRYLLLTQCHALQKIFPDLFEKKDDFTEPFLPENLLDKRGFLGSLIKRIDAEMWKNQPDILALFLDFRDQTMRENPVSIHKIYGQTYDDPFVCNVAITPGWAIDYLAENTIGRKWLDAYPEDEYLKKKWAYYLDEVSEKNLMEEPVLLSSCSKLDYLRSLTIFDPCAGSGRMLAHAFEVLMDLYRSCQVDAQTAARSILKNNLIGLGVSEPTVSMCKFTLMMEACKYAPGLLETPEQLQIYSYTDGEELLQVLGVFGVYSILGLKKVEVNVGGLLSRFDVRDSFSSISGETIYIFFQGMKKCGPLFQGLEECNIEEMKNILSLLEECNIEKMKNILSLLFDQSRLLTKKSGYFAQLIDQAFLPVIHVLDCMTRKYDIILSESPQKGSIPTTFLIDYIHKYYHDNVENLKNTLNNMWWSSIADYCLYDNILLNYSKKGTITGYLAKNWEKDSLFSPLRSTMYMNSLICNTMLLPALDRTHILWTARVMPQANRQISDYQSIRVHLEKLDGVEAKQSFFDLANRTSCYYGPSYEQKEKIDFLLDKMVPAFKYSLDRNQEMRLYYELSEDPLEDMFTGLSVRYWFEINRKDILYNKEELNRYADTRSKKGFWMPFFLQNGDLFRKWYGNEGLVAKCVEVDCSIKNRNLRYFREEAMIWYENCKRQTVFTYEPWLFYNYNLFHASYAKFAYMPEEKFSKRRFQEDTNEDTNCEDLMLSLAFCNSCVAAMLLELFCNEKIGDFRDLPIGEPIDIEDKISIDLWRNQIIELARDALALSMEDWNESEKNVSFQKHPLIVNNYHLLSEAYNKWQAVCESRFVRLKKIEEKINSLYIENYHLEALLSPVVEEQNVSVYRLYDTLDAVPESMKGCSYVRTKRDAIISLISYAVGCLFGRYSLDEPGLVFAGGAWKKAPYKTIPAKNDNIFLVYDKATDNKNDLMNNFVHWLEIVYGKESLEDNLCFISETLGGEGAPRDIIRTYFAKYFFEDHCTQYHNLPFYWMFDGGKKAEFKALLYYHRFNKNTLKNLEKVIYKEIENIDKTLKKMDQDVKQTKSELAKQKKYLESRRKALNAYTNKIAKCIESGKEVKLDDGILKNYKKFSSLLVKIPVNT